MTKKRSDYNSSKLNTKGDEETATD